jgi:menaquinone-dependent protoporphyrinogen oxidase
MKILIAAASKHGSTLEIAAAIGDELRRAGYTVDVYDAKEAPSAAPYDAAIVGSAVYAGSWLGEARSYVADNQAALAGKPVWLFTSGPLGAENPQPVADPAQLPELLAQSGARGHEIFVGKLDKESLSFGEKLIVKAVKAPYGDFRDWQAISAWAADIAEALVPVSA